jgi:hypothetical protein
MLGSIPFQLSQFRVCFSIVKIGIGNGIDHALFLSIDTGYYCILYMYIILASSSPPSPL